MAAVGVDDVTELDDMRMAEATLVVAAAVAAVEEVLVGVGGVAGGARAPPALRSANVSGGEGQAQTGDAVDAQSEPEVFRNE